MATFSIGKILTRDVFDEAIDVEWTAMLDPFRPEFPWLHPVHGYTEADRLASLKADKDRRWQQYNSNPASHWVAVTESESGLVVGAAEWQIYTENPFPNGPIRIECTWFPEGETRDFVTEVINQCYYTRMNWMDRPHVSLTQMAVLPDWRRRGVGGIIMAWGLQNADRLDLEVYLEASRLGKSLYERHGFQTLLTFAVDTYKKNASQTWTKLHHEFPTITCTCMWRPAMKHVGDEPEATFWDILKKRTTRGTEVGRAIGAV